MSCHSLLQGIFWPRDWTQVSCTAGRFFTNWATRERKYSNFSVGSLLVCCCCWVTNLGPIRCDPIQPHQAPLSSPISWSLLKFLSIVLVTLSNHLILCHPLLLLPSIFPSIGFLPNESALWIKWPKYWSFSFSNSPSDKYSGLISRIDWFHLLAIQGTLKSLLQHHSLKASVLQRLAFLIAQL